jgi:hypothetical protein
MTGYSWYLGGPAVEQSAPWIYSSAIFSGGSLFVLSYLYYSRKHSTYSLPQRYLLSVFDLATYFCALVLGLWGLIFPILHPISNPDFELYLFGQKSLAIGLYTGLVLCSLVVGFRIALQFLLSRSSKTVMIITAPQVPVVQQVDAKERESLEDSLSSIRSEIAMLREQIASLSYSMVWKSRATAAPTVEPQENNSEWPIGESEPISFPFAQVPVSSAPPVRELQVVPGNLSANSGVPRPAAIPQEYEPTTGEINLPDSARDNPWASVLSLRQVKSIPAAPPDPAPEPFEEQKIPVSEPIVPQGQEKLPPTLVIKVPKKSRRASRSSGSKSPKFVPKPEIPAIPVESSQPIVNSQLSQSSSDNSQDKTEI